MSRLNKPKVFIMLILGTLLSTISTTLYASTMGTCTIRSSEIKNSTDYVFVDVRNKKFFNRERIPGSINIPQYLIKSKKFLKSKNVILVNSGWNIPDLIQQCTELMASGFKSVKVLQGGVSGWYKHKNKKSNVHLISITSHEFFNNTNEIKYVPFVITDSDKNKVEKVIPHAKVYPTNVPGKQLINHMSKLGKSENPIVIFSENANLVDAVFNKYSSKSNRAVYLFDGGIEKYKEKEKLNEMLKEGHKNKRFSTKKPVSCAN